MWWWFWLWIVFILFVIALPVGYGSGYRRWGAPYPRYYRDRRGRTMRIEDAEPVAQESGWGWFGDVVWLLILAAIVWALVWAWAY